MHQRLTSVALLLVLAALGGCSDDGVKLTTCPAKGIGVTASSGESCATALATNPKGAVGQDCLAQFSDYKTYDCQEPQIGLDKTKLPLTIGVNPNSAFIDVYWTITNCAGPNGRKLNIKGIGIAGDSGCFFSAEPEIEAKVVDPGKQISMRVQFKPKAVGENHAAIYLVSDAQNYPTMILPVCVKVLDKAPAGDGGVARDLSVPSFDCKDVIKDVPKPCNDTCHPGCSAVLKM